MTTDKEKYRDKIATVDEEGKRIWIYPTKPKGRFYKYRTWVSWVLLAILFGLPFVKVNGEPFVLLNVLERKFILFGLHFAPQDFHLFVLAMLTLLVFIVLFTVIYGRLFCGWVCPQTIFMEMVFRKIEYWIEGDAAAQRRLDKSPLTAEKIKKKTLKHAVFILISVIIAHTFLSYIVGLDRVTEIVTQPPTQNLGGFFAMLGFTGAFYMVFSRLREQVCTTICPYGRLQGVMTDQNTILVTYDFKRGEPRGKLKKKKNPVKNIAQTVANAAASPEAPVVEEKPMKILGDCIDCGLCVRVCPTGIDIRDGVQLECVNCTACIDACDSVMTKINRPTGLIRYDSYNGIVAGERKIFTPRAIAYSVVLAILVGVNIFLLANRSDVEAVILRTPGMLYQKVDETHLSNLYNYQIFNKTGKELPLELKLKTPYGKLKLVGDPPVAPPNEVVEGAFFIEMDKDHLDSRKTTLDIEVWSNGKIVDEVSTSFLGPIK
ncbi:MAG: cytochrome c oxidase accessory protein CcoG [Bacteroidetes bacterium]|nr:MAG: cytochrome c oxidase accessory protein CcoG [Bacteroidota bacterium]